MTYWNDDRDDILRQMRGERASINQIAARLGVSRNAVAGRSLRLGLSVPKANPVTPVPPEKRARLVALLTSGMSIAAAARGAKVSEPTARQQYRRMQEASAHDAERARVGVAERAAANIQQEPRRLGSAHGPGNGVGMADLRHGQCAWPLWPNRAPPTFRCCGEPVAQGSYCRTHAQRAYAPKPSVRAKEAA